MYNDAASNSRPPSGFYFVVKKKHAVLVKRAGLAAEVSNERLPVIIETPKGSRNKYAYDHKQRIYKLKKVLPAGMSFPYDFGFVPQTRADDGDPIDVLVLMDEPAFPASGSKLVVYPHPRSMAGDTARRDG